MLTLQATLDGLLLGILFALIAYGMALQWGVMNIINIAQGDLVILGGYIALYVSFWNSSSMGNYCMSYSDVFCWCWNLQNSN